jgi:hypothetical protein
LARIGSLVGTQVQVCMFSLPHPPQGGLGPFNLVNPFCASRIRR